MRFLARLLKLIVGLLMLAAVFFSFAAYRGDRGDIEEEISIDRPAPAVFRWLTSEELLRRWIMAAVKVETGNSAAAGATSGRTMRIEEMVANQPVVLDLQIIQVVPNQMIEWHVRSASVDGCQGKAIVKLMAEDGYTQVSFSSHMEFISLTDQFFEPAFTYATRRKLHEDLLRLKLMMEAEPAVQPDVRSRPTKP